MNRIKIKSLSPTPLLIIMAIATLIAVPLRTFQLTNCVEPSTGFWLKQDFTVPFLTVLLILVVAAAFFISLFSGIMPEAKFTEKRNIPLGIASILFVFGFLADSVTQMSKYVLLLGEYDSTKYGSLFTYMVSSGTLALTLQSLFGLLSAIYMAFAAFSFIAESNKYTKVRLLALSPVLWGIAKMIYYFANPISYKNVSQLLLELGTLTFYLLFSLSFARIASGVNEEKSSWVLWFSGISGALFGYVSALAPVVLLVTGKSAYISANYPLQYLDLIFAVFATIVLLSYMPRTVKNHTEA